MSSDRIGSFLGARWHFSRTLTVFTITVGFDGGVGGFLQPFDASKSHISELRSTLRTRIELTIGTSHTFGEELVEGRFAFVKRPLRSFALFGEFVDELTGFGVFCLESLGQGLGFVESVFRVVEIFVQLLDAVISTEVPDEHEREKAHEPERSTARDDGDDFGHLT